MRALLEGAGSRRVMNGPIIASGLPPPPDWRKMRPIGPGRVVAHSSLDTVARLLAAARAGDAAAPEALASMVYDELRRLARMQIRRERPGQTLQPTALANEVWMRLMGAGRLDVRDRSHFLGIAARAMRQILIERARARKAAKRGGAPERVTLDEALAGVVPRSIDVEALDEALDRLAAAHPAYARLVELRFFAGLTVEEAADVLDSSPATVKRHWAFAKAWLYRELEGL
jgi:RNA polymerase sigma factor (TIGR02999 family)